MITFPPEFVTTKFYGYYWNTKTQRLYSIKVTGELRELKKAQQSPFNQYKDGYRVSVKGVRRWLLTHNLKQLLPDEIQVAHK